MNTISPPSEPLPEETNPDLITTQSNGELFTHLINKEYISKPALWFSILWNIIINFGNNIFNNLIVVCCVVTYIVMTRFESTRAIIVAIYIFFAIFWSIFPYYLRCIMMYKITGISTCGHKLIYSLIGLICWCIALFIYN
jgi:hypothetical protein